MLNFIKKMGNLEVSTSLADVFKSSRMMFNFFKCSFERSAFESETVNSWITFPRL